MNLIRSFLLAIFLLASVVRLHAQNVKPKFKNITFIGYYASAMTNTGPRIMDYSIIFSNDSVHYTANNFAMKNHEYGMSDTAYRIPDTLTRDLNKISDGKKLLKSHMITNKLKNGDSTYSDHIYFITYDAGKTSPDSFIAVQPFLDKQLSGLIDKITSLPRGKIIMKRKIYHDRALENQVLECQKTCNYIPKPTPPTLKELKVAN